MEEPMEEDPANEASAADILYAVLAGFSSTHGLAEPIVILMVAQPVGIVVYYLMVFLLRPYPSDFAAWLFALLQGRRERRAQGRLSLVSCRLRYWPPCRSCSRCCR